jgi:hypothetical protein
LFAAAIPSKLRMMPQRVPKGEINGAAEPRVARTGSRASRTPQLGVRALPYGGTDGSNSSPSSGESAAKGGLMCRRQRSGGTDGSNPVPSSGES